MCLSPSMPDAPKPPPAAPNYEAVTSSRDDERKRQLAAAGNRSNIATGIGGVQSTANTGRTILGG
jgi:hypothetical protein